jgi:hypothetical protein
VLGNDLAFAADHEQVRNACNPVATGNQPIAIFHQRQLPRFRKFLHRRSRFRRFPKIDCEYREFLFADELLCA